MKLGEALSLRANQVRTLGELKQRILANTTYQEGEKPAESPEDLLHRFEKLSEEHSELVSNIITTNVKNQEILLQKLQQREHLRRLRNMLQQAADASAIKNTRWMRTEIKMVAELDVAVLQEKIEDYSERIRKIDAEIQESNWQIEV